MHILVATDAWHPQVNGVVRTLAMTAEAAKALGADVSFLTPQSFRTFAMPSYPDLRLALAVSREDRAPDTRGAARQHSYRDRRPDRTIGAALLPQTRPAIHHQLPHPLSRICLGAFAGSRVVDLGRAAPVSSRKPGGDGGDAGAGQRIARARLSQCRVVAARGRHRPVSSARRRSRPAASGLSLRRPRRGGKESRGVSRSRSARHQSHRRRRAGAGGVGAKVSASRVPRCKAGRGIGRGLCRGRCLRVSEQDRHLRPGAAGGPGKRRAGGRFSRDRSPRRARLGAGRRVERRSAAGVPRRAADLAAGLPRICRRAYAGRLRREPSSKTWPMSAASNRNATWCHFRPSSRASSPEEPCLPLGVRDTTRQ